MCNVNFVAEFNAFMRFAEDNLLGGRERLLWIALFHAANKRAAWNEQTREYDWPEDFFPVSNDALHSSACLDKRAVGDVRNSLKQQGLIDFIPGERNKRHPKYRLNYLSVGGDIAPNNTPNKRPAVCPTSDQQCYQGNPNDVPRHEPKEAPVSKYKTNTEDLTSITERMESFAKKRLNVDDNWNYSTRARMATAQVVVNALVEDAIWGKDPEQTRDLYDMVMDAMDEYELSPTTIYLMGKQSTTRGRFHERILGVP